MILLDTNILSELMRARPAERVAQWVDDQPAASLFTTTLTQAEILYGIEILDLGKRKRGLRDAADAMFREDFPGRVLSFDSSAAGAFATIAASRRRAGKPISQVDAQIAAVANSRGAVLATRNTSDFSDCGIELFNPWESV